MTTEVLDELEQLKLAATISGVEVSGFVLPDSRHLLGSYGLLAESSDARGSATHERLLVPVTSTLRKWKSAPAAGEKIQILVEPVDGKGRPLKAYDWKAREIAFEVR